MRLPLALLLALAPAGLSEPLTVVPVASPGEGLAKAGEWPVVFQGGPQVERLGRARVRWGDPGRELYFGPQAQRAREVRARTTSGMTPVVRIPSPPGGEPRLYLSDRDSLVAFTVDFGTWDTCPEIRGLRPGGVEVVPLPCPEAGAAALRALQEAGHVAEGKDARPRMRFRLANVRYVEPGFLAAGGVELDAELRLATRSKEPAVYRARFLLRDGHIQSCTLLD